jgi:hypothetical protein
MISSLRMRVAGDLVVHGEVFAHREGFTVAHHHAACLAAGYPTANPGLHAWLGQADLVARTLAGVHVGVGRQLDLVRAPAHLGRGDALFVEAVDTPGVDELVGLLRPIGDLRVAFGDVDDLRAGVHRQHVEPGAVVAGRGESGFQGNGIGGQAALQHRRGDLDQCLLGEVAHHAGVGAVFEHRRGAAVVGPGTHHAAQIHVAHVQRAVERVGAGQVDVRVPHLDAGVQVANVPVAAPCQHGGVVDVPRQVEQQVAAAHPARQELVEVVGGEPVDLVGDAPFDRVGHTGAVVGEVDDGDARRVDLQVAQQQWHHALGHRTATEDEHPLRVRTHSTGRGARAASSVSSVAASALASSVCQSYAMPLRPRFSVPSN